MLVNKTVETEQQKQLLHAEKMRQEFTPEKVIALRTELTAMKQDLTESLPYVDITTEQGKAKFWKMQGELDLIETWLKLPEKTQSFLESVKERFAEFFVQ